MKAGGGAGGSAMSQAEWKDVMNLILAAIGREPPPIQVFIYLFAALAAVLFAEGVRTIFFRPMARAAASAPPLKLPRMAKKEAPAGDMAQSQAFEARPTKFTPRQPPTLARNPKRHIVELRRFTATRPQIRRTGPQRMAVAAPPSVLESLEQPETAPGL
jgi:hypothetical protein